MNAPAGYTPYHPRWYRRRVSVWWWLESWPYTRFVLRELTSLAVAYFSVLALWKVSAIAEGPRAYADFLARLQSPFFLVLNILAFLGILFHSITWFNLAPKALVVRVGGKRLPDWVIQAGNYAAWLAFSAGAVWFLGRG